MTLEQLEERAEQLVLHSRLNYAYRRMQEYLQSSKTWGATHAGVLKARPVAYFSAEFGIHESLPIYSGGLGILAGDHIKSASDLGIPLVGVGLFYAQGYFRQRLDQSGWQHEDYLDVDVRQLPLELLIGRDNQPGHGRGRDPRRDDLGAGLEGDRRPDHAAAARLRRRVEHARGPPADGAALRRRPRGSGSARSCSWASAASGPCKALNIHPGVLHLNEGHSAFAGPGDDPRPDEDRGARLRGGDAAGVDHDVLHHAHARAGRPRPVLRRS